MKKHLILTAALVVTVFSFAQKKEIKALEKAIKSTNFAEAKTLVSQLESMVGAMDGKMKDKYYLTAAKAFFANGSSTGDEVTKSLDLLSKYSNQNSSEISQFKKSIENDLLTKANGFYTGKQYEKAASAFENLYNVTKTDPTYLYYAASSAISGGNMDIALKQYIKLNELGYTGVENQYFATNKESGEKEVLIKSVRDSYIKIGTHENPGERKTESKVAEITKNIALIYADKGENDKALAAMQQAREANPDDSNLLVSEANLQYKLGNIKEYESLISQALVNDPNNAELTYNMAVLSNEAGNSAKAKELYLKAISIEPTSPKNINSYINLSALILDQEKTIVDVMNSLGTSAADNIKYDELKAQRMSLYQEAIPHLEKALEIDVSIQQVGITLSNIYSAIGEDAKAKALKEKYN